MKLLVLQLSDIHFKSEGNIICERIEAIKNAIQGAGADFDACLIAMTGDVAFSGRAEEYKVADTFFDNLWDAISSIRSGLHVFEIYIPGNHDCLLPKEARAREVQIKALLADPPKEAQHDNSLLNNCLQVQSHFFEFLKRRCPEVNAMGDAPNSQLSYFNEFAIGGKRIRVQCYNTALLSLLHERQGELLAPIWREPGQHSSDVTLTLFHHPYNWLEAINGRAFRTLVEHSSDLVLTGHEHVSEQYTKRTIRNETMDYLEGAVLQESGTLESGFNIIVFDLETQQYRIALYEWQEDYYVPVHQRDWQRFERNRLARERKCEVTDDFRKYLSRCDVAFTHPRKDPLNLSDVFVYPDFMDHSLQRKSAGGVQHKIIVGDQIHVFISSHKRALILGGEKSGKTALAKMFYHTLLSEGKRPLLIPGGQLKNHEERAFLRLMDRCVSDQYGADAVERYHQLDKDARTLIIDDLHSTGLNSRGVSAMMEHAGSHFETIVLLASDTFSIEEIVQKAGEGAGLLGFERCSIRSFGHRLRGQLIEKWMRLGQEYTADETEISRKIKEAEHLMNTLIGRNFSFR